MGKSAPRRGHSPERLGAQALANLLEELVLAVVVRRGGWPVGEQMLLPGLDKRLGKCAFLVGENRQVRGQSRDGGEVGSHFGRKGLLRN